MDIIRRGENPEVVFRPDTITNGAFAKEVAALMNLRGGRVILGVEDDGSVTGITRDCLEEWVMTACRDKIRPELIPYCEIIRDVEHGKDVAIVSPFLLPATMWLVDAAVFHFLKGRFKSGTAPDIAVNSGSL